MKSDLPFEIPGGYGTGYDEVLTSNDESRNPQKSEDVIPPYILQKSKHITSNILINIRIALSNHMIGHVLITSHDFSIS